MSDLNSLILYESLTGRVPFEAETAVAIALKQVSEPPVPPRQINPEIPPALYEQLKDGGRLVLPRGSRDAQRLVLVVKAPDGPAERASVACRFVPLLGEQGFDEE